MFGSTCLRRSAAALFVVVLQLSGGLAGAVTIDTVPVGNPGNVGELSGVGAGGSGPDGICGSVSYKYNIGKYEVTAGQYVEFLGAVAATDTYGLYDATDLHGCYITRNGTSGSYTYDFSGRPGGTTQADWSNRPVGTISWGDAARFANWLHNGQPTGGQDVTTTEDGAYYVNGATSSSALMNITRKSGAIWFIPTEDEWYKAAYHKNDGVTGNYFDYPTSNDNTPSNDLVNPTDPGNNANFNQGGYTIGSPYWSTEVGEFENSESPYNTFDQGGNLWEWNETAIGSLRGLRGGDWINTFGWMAASRRYSYDPATKLKRLGFRVASVPEPGGITLLVCGLLAGMMCRRSRR
ncbi:MAG: formylglycine-generating enzyme family protein [bacterium]|nr:formylglycine-generating enzyme family protein [bacterium]